MMTPAKHIVFLALGSNLGDRIEHCQTALQYINNISETTILKKSEWFDNPALGKSEDDPDFINSVVQIETSLNPEDLLEKLQGIEKEMGRPHSQARWAPRIIDLDILLYDDIVVDLPTLQIPHPEMIKRVFVLKPLCDIDPNIIHPVVKETAQELLERLEQKS